MDSKRIITYVVLLLVGLGLGYTISRAQNNQEKPQPSKARVTANTSTTPIQEGTEEGTKTTIDTANTNIIAEEEEEDPIPAEEEGPDSSDEETLIADTGNDIGELPSADLCYKPGSDELKKTLLIYTQQLERDSLWYNNAEPDKLLDCSGIFHRVSQFISTKCDAYQYPELGSTRDTRALAGWYYDNNNLVIIHDAAKQRNLIKPGTVMFFGRSGRAYNNLTIERLKTPIPNHVIMHVGVVTDVKTDANGDVINYTMFHGRRPGKVASSTYYHKLKPPRVGFPPLGNWNQQLVAVANIMTPK